MQEDSAVILKGSQEIAHEMHTLDDLTKAISVSMNEMANGATKINHTVSDITQLTRNNRESIEELSDAVRKFKVGAGD